MSNWEHSGTPASRAASGPAGTVGELIPALYDRAGRRIDFATYVRLHLDNPGCEHVVAERVDPYWVSTLWFGIDAGLVPGPRRVGHRRAPAVYRTMVERLEADAPDPQVFGLAPEALRYATESDAREGHAHVVRTLRDVTESATAERPSVRETSA